jgi:hypothetical protein
MEEITVILNGYKRPEYLKEQVSAIRSQSIPAKEIWLWRNDCAWPVEEHVDVVVDSSRNFKYHGRFALGLLAQTKYLAFFDDDTIPGKDWFKNCLNVLKEKGECILGGAGCILRSPRYVDHIRAGWPSPTQQSIEVDLVGHAWFLERKTLNNVWLNVPPTFENGEDMQLAFQANISNGIKSYCPPHDPSDQDSWSSLKAWEYGNDTKASSNGSLMGIPEFYKERDDIIDHYLRNGYTPVLARSSNAN